jgi:hypothetical protein
MYAVFIEEQRKHSSRQPKNANSLAFGKMSDVITTRGVMLKARMSAKVFGTVSEGFQNNAEGISNSFEEVSALGVCRLHIAKKSTHSTQITLWDKHLNTH